MASIFHSRPQGDAPFKRRAISAKRSVQSMGGYFGDLLGKWKWTIVGVLALASVLIVLGHQSSRVVARSLITFQLGNAVQNGLLPAGELNGLVGSIDSMRDRQLQFMQSHEFARLLANVIAEKSEHALVRKELNSFQSSSWGLKRDWSLQDKLSRMILFTSQGANNIMIEVHGPNQEFSQKLADLINEFGLSVIKATHFQNIATQKKSLEEQINGIKEEVSALNDESIAFKEKNNLFSVQTLPEELRNSITNLSKTLLETEIQLKENDYLLSEVSKKANTSHERILATQGIGFHDQVLEAKEQELRDQRSLLVAKIKGLREVFSKEKARFGFISSGEEKLAQLKAKINSKLEHLNLYENKLKAIEGTAQQLDQSIRALGQSYIYETQNTMPLPVKLIMVNISLFFLLSMAIFYWYEVFPVLSYRHQAVTEMDVESMPWFGSKTAAWSKHGAPIAKQAQRLFAQKVLKKLSGPGVHQVISADRGDGKSMLTGMLAQELHARGETVCIVDLSGKGEYGQLSKDIKILKDSTTIENVLAEPESVRFLGQGAPWILVDSGALKDNMGHLLVSPSMDGIIFVGSYLQTKTDAFTDWQFKIEQLVGKKAVFVLNKTDLRVDLPFLLIAPAVSQEHKSIRKVS